MSDDRMYDFALPDLGEGVIEGELVKFLVKEGEQVEADQPLLQIMTDKATVEIPSPRKARVVAIRAEEGQIVPVGSVMVTLELAEGETRPITMHHAPPPGTSAAPAPSPAPTPASVVAAPEPKAPEPLPPAPAAAPPAPAPMLIPAVAASLAAVAAPSINGKVLAAPATRQLARTMGVDIATVPGSGPAGRITREDILAAGGATAPVAVPAALGAPAAAPSAPAAAAAKAGLAPVASWEGDERRPLRGLRRKIAEKMVQSAFTAPHVTHFDEVDMTALVALRARLKPLADTRGAKLSYMPFIIKAAIATCRKLPFFNAHFDDATQELVLRKPFHIGFAAQTDNGLMVPVVRDAQDKSLLDLAESIQAIAGRAREGKATMDELSGSTLTISNVGSLGGLFATPILNYPEVAILGVNKIQKRPVVRDGVVVVRDMMYLGLSFDHRVIDGADAVAFVNQMIAYLEQPDLLFVDMV
ncbi:MAG: dihydrolipoamide acetyltransferase family protein [Candidatus Sericytochromatia bacterium]|nr:dihydrolipoamide acetyltransferase family protein [Candidatus Sericytochromatia bacterium]